MIVKDEKELAKILHIKPRSFYHHMERYEMTKEQAMEHAINSHNTRLWKKRCPKEWRAFQSMKQRTLNRNNPRYDLYSVRGISEEFCGRFGFLHFIRMVGPMPDYSLDGKLVKWSIDRIDNNRGYLPGNMRWATQTQQVNNRKNTFKYHEELKRNGVPLSTFYGRIKRGWSLEKAINTPPKERRTYGV